MILSSETPRRRVRVTTVFTVGLTTAIACSDRTFEVLEPEYGEPVCMLAVSSGHWDDGRSHLIRDVDGTGLHPAGCACLPSRYHDEWTDEELDMLAELALAECEDMAEAEFDFDWNDCQEDFTAKAWYLHVFYVGPDGDSHGYMPDDLFCVAPD